MIHKTEATSVIKNFQMGIKCTSTEAICASAIASLMQFLAETGSAF